MDIVIFNEKTSYHKNGMNYDIRKFWKYDSPLSFITPSLQVYVEKC